MATGLAGSAPLRQERIVSLCHPGCYGAMLVHCKLHLLGSSNSPASATRSKGFSMLVRLVLNSRPEVILPPRPPKVLALQNLESASHLKRLLNKSPMILMSGILSVLNKSLMTLLSEILSIGSMRVLERQGFTMLARLERLISNDSPASTSQSAGITGVSCRTQPAGVSLLSPRLECSDVTSAHCYHRLLGSRDSPASVSQAAVQTRFHHVGQAGLKLLTLGDPPTSASQSARITGGSKDEDEMELQELLSNDVIEAYENGARGSLLESCLQH
ncbi:hypothetical protein AAY473_001498 [Plecturocebus cupreus]